MAPRGQSGRHRPMRWRGLALAIVGLSPLVWVLGCANVQRIAARHGPPEAKIVHAAFDADLAARGSSGVVPPGPLAVRDVRPEGPSDGTGIRLRLDRALVDVEAPPRDVALVLDRIDATGARHTVAARSRWTRPDTLVLEPEDALPDATAFEVRLAGAIVDPAGSRIEGTSWRFETSRPSLERHETWEELHDRMPLWLVPSSAIDPVQLAAHVHVRGDGRDVAVDVRRVNEEEIATQGFAATTLAIVPRRGWPAGAELDITVDDRLVGTAGPLPIATAWRDRVRVRPAFAIGALDCAAAVDGRCALGSVRIATSTVIDEASFERIRVEPPLDDVRIHHDFDGDGPGIAIDGDWRPATKYRVVFDRRIRDQHGRALGRTKRIAVQIANELAQDDASIGLSSTSGIFTSPAAAKIAVRTHRVTALDVRIARVRAVDVPALVGVEELAELPWPETDRETRSHHVLTPTSRSSERVLIDVGHDAALGEVVLVEATARRFAPRSTAPAETTVRGVYRFSALGVVAHRGPRHGFVRVTSVVDGSPIEHALVELLADGKRTRRKTDRHGIARIPGAGDEPAPPLVLVTRDDDAVALRLAAQPALREDDRRAGKMTRAGTLAVQPKHGSKGTRVGVLRAGELPTVQLHTGRAVYQADDHVNVAGWASISTPHDALATRRVPPRTKVRLALRQDDNEIATKTVRIDEHGRFHGTLRIPGAPRLGEWRVEATLLGASAIGRIVVAETRIPTFIAILSAGPDILRGADIVAQASARHLSGEAATIDVASATMTCRPSGPPRMEELEPGFDATCDGDADPVDFGGDGALDGARATWRFPTTDLDPRLGWSCAMAVAVADRGLQEVGADDWVYVRPANVHLALRRARAIAGQRHTIDAIAVDATGRRVALDDVEIEIDRKGDTGRPGGRCRVDIAAAGAFAHCRTARLREGEYRVVAHARADGRLVHIEHDLWVDPAPHPASLPVAPAEVSTPPLLVRERERAFEILVADELAAGKRAKVQIVAPWDEGTGVLAVEQIGLRETFPFVLQRGRATVHVVPSADLGPSIELIARVARGGGEGALPTEHTTSASAAVIRDRELRVRITNRTSAEIGTRVPIRIDVHDQGLPVDARVAIWVVDAGLDELRTAHGPSLGAFDRDRRHERGVARTYDALLDPTPGWFFGRTRRAPAIRMAHAEVKGGLGDRPMRRRFDAAPLFVGNVGTGSDGVATVDLDLPDDLTRFRITAIASAPLEGHPEGGPARFGVAHGAVTTTTPLVVRPAMPRALRPGDVTTIAALVSMPRDGDVEVALELPDDSLRAIGPTRRRVNGRRGEIARVAFTVEAHDAGEPRVRLHATLREATGKRAREGGVEARVAIRRERTQTERVALYGSIDDEKVHALPLLLPRRATPSSGTLEVTTTASLLGDFTEAATYLSDYPYGCVEQSASRLVPLVALHALGDRTREAEAAREQASAIVGHILSMQLADGSFAYWPGSATSAGFAGGYALWILQLGRRAGFEVPADALAQARAALARHVRATKVDGETVAPELPQDGDEWLTHAMILHALADAGDAAATDFDLAWAHRDRLSTAGRALLAMALHRALPEDPRVAELSRGLGALLEERAAVAHFTRSDGAHTAAWDSPARDDALGLMALMQLDPKSALADKVAAGLVGRRARGRWRTTQENAFALLALAEYAKQREATVPNHRVRAWIGDRPVLDARVTTRDDVRRGGTIPLDAVRDAKGTAAVTLARKGSGRVHWRVGVQWTEAAPPARAQGLRLATRILDEHDAEVTRMIVGRRYRIEVRLASETPQQHIAVDVPLPAGVDAIDRTLGHGVAARAASTVDSSELSHLELRADRATLFFDELDPGTTVQQIAVLATAAGTYSLPGAVAEAMYEPETFARTRAAQIVIDPQTP